MITGKPRGRPKKVKEEVETTAKLEVPPTYDEYGVCIACKGGKEGCLHNNLTTSGRNTVCTVCGLCIK